MQTVDVYTSVADAAYQGAPGAYSEEAAHVLLGTDARLMPCATLEQTFEAVVDERASHAVVPVENAVSGTVPGVYEQLLAHDFVVTGEVALNIDHVLVGAKGATRQQDYARDVSSHRPRAVRRLLPCASWRRGRHRVRYGGGGADGGRIGRSSDGRHCVASRRRDVRCRHSRRTYSGRARELDALHVDHGRTPTTQSRAGHKAILACGLRHEPGSLAQALQMLAAGGLSVTKIEGRPLRGKPFEYRFVVETIAHDGRAIDERDFGGLAAKTEWFRILGIYDPGRQDV